jgi:hypothetical protein
MLKISDKYLLEYLNGYYVAHEQAVWSSDSKHAGKQYTCRSHTYPTLLRAWSELKLKGCDGNKVLSVADRLMKIASVEQGKSMREARERKANK